MLHGASGSIYTFKLAQLNLGQDIPSLLENVRVALQHQCALTHAHFFLTVTLNVLLFFFFFPSFFGKVGTFLVDVAHRNVENTGSVQAWGTSARNMGSLVASLITAGIYACNDDQSFPAGKDAGIDPVMCYYILV